MHKHRHPNPPVNSPPSAGPLPFSMIVAEVGPSPGLRLYGSELAAYVTKYKLSTVLLGLYPGDVDMLQNGDAGTVSALQAIFATGAAVMPLVGDDSWFSNPSTVDPVYTQLVEKVLPNYPFAGLAFDLEPQADVQWSSNRAAIISAYQTILKNYLKVGTGKETWILTAPYWDVSMFANVEALPQVTGTICMDYTTPAATQVADATIMLKYLKKPYWIASLTDVGNGADSYYGYSQANFIAQQAALASGCKALNSNLRGICINAWAATQNEMPASLQTLVP